MRHGILWSAYLGLKVWNPLNDVDVTSISVISDVYYRFDSELIKLFWITRQLARAKRQANPRIRFISQWVLQYSGVEQSALLDQYKSYHLKPYWILNCYWHWLDYHGCNYSDTVVSWLYCTVRYTNTPLPPNMLLNWSMLGQAERQCMFSLHIFVSGIYLYQKFPTFWASAPQLKFMVLMVVYWFDGNFNNKLKWLMGIQYLSMRLTLVCGYSPACFKKRH